jgi:branched-chain amino acid aminotransferase
VDAINNFTSIGNFDLNFEDADKDELADFVECGLCGTAAVISPVGEIDDHGKQIIYNEGKQEMGPKLKEIYDTLTGIQMGRLPAPEGWVYTI